MVEPVAFLMPRNYRGPWSECVCMCVCVYVMPHGPVSIPGQAEDGCDSQMNAGVWVSAAL